MSIKTASHTKLIYILCVIMVSKSVIFAQSGSSKSTLIFIDKSRSVDFTTSKEVEDRIQISTDTLLRTRYTRSKDKLQLYFIHTNTAGAAKIKEFEFPTNNCNNQPSNIKKHQCGQAFSNRIITEKRNIKTDIKNLLNQANPYPSGNYTNIHAILEVASRNFTNTNQSREIYVFSDMIHTCQKYNLTKCPSSRADAEALGKKHAEDVRKELKINQTLLAGIRVIVVTPDDSMNPIKNKQALRYYWVAFFNAFKMKFEME